MKIFVGLLNTYIIGCAFGQFNYSYLKTVKNDSCGLATGGPIVQQLTKSISYAGGLFWADAGEKIAYIDRYRPAIGRYTPRDGRFNQLAVTMGKEAIAIFPIRNDTTGLKFLVGLDNSLVLAVVTGTANNLIGTYYDIYNIADSADEIFMKGKIDKLGRLWYASEGKDFSGLGKLYKIYNLGSPEIMEHNLISGAGMAWTQDYKYFYLVDSGIGIIYKYDFNLENGTIANRKIIFKLSEHNLDGIPFDIVVDTSGYLWIGMLHGGSVIQYDENSKEVLWNVPIPASNPVALEFGGLDKKTLYVGTAKYSHGYKIAGRAGDGSIYAISGLGVTGIVDNDVVIPEEFLTL